jgi:Na+-driven multidrug efflux pump
MRLIKLETKNLLHLAFPIFIENTLRMASIYFLYMITSLISDDISAILGVTNLCVMLGFILSDSIAQSNAIAISHAIGKNEDHKLHILYSAFLYIVGNLA